MTLQSNTNHKNSSQVIINPKPSQEIQDEPILCPHCQRTASNGIKCKGICVSDSDY